MYRRGEVLLIPVPFTDLSTSKKRPVLVVSNDKYNAQSQDMIVVAITPNPVQTGIPITQQDMVSGYLPKSSIIRGDKIYALDQGIVVKRIGVLSPAIQEAIKNEIESFIN